MMTLMSIAALAALAPIPVTAPGPDAPLQGTLVDAARTRPSF